jgi:hypothetical protein
VLALACSRSSVSYFVAYVSPVDGKWRRSFGTMIRGIGVAAFILLTSCTASRTQFVARQPVAEQVRVITSYKTGIPESKTVGAPIIEREYLKFYPGFVATDDFDIPKISGFNTSPSPIRKEERWVCMQHISADVYACSAITSDRSIAPGKRKYDLAINKSGEVVGILEETFGEFIKFGNVIGGKLLPIDVLTGKSYKQKLIYSGLSEDTLKLSCREYKNEMPRPVFEEELTYNLANSREIEFQDLRIEILYATESTLNFYVKK